MPRTQPNVVIITCHDLGQHLHCYGVEGVRSPRIDALAAEGVRFANSFCTAPQCSPSRASLFTGRYPHSNGVMGLTHADFAWDLHDQERHLATLLRDAGYQTTAIGVTHETRHADRHGFDQRLGGRGDREMAQAAAKVIHDAAKTDKPFYLQVGFFQPHRARPGFGTAPDTANGISVPPYLVDDLGAREEFAYFQGCVNSLDANVGVILDALTESGQADDTLFIFTTDHGIPFPRAKCSVYDPGLEVALIVRHPRGGVTGGRVYEPMISNVDYVPTLLDWLGVARPGDAPPLQGRSFAALLRGEAYVDREEIFGEMTFHDYCDPRRCVRTTTHKLIVNFSTAPFFMNPSQSWRPKTVTVDPPEPAYAYHQPVELYDLRRDPLETCNLAEDPDHAQVCADLLGRVHGWMTDTADPLLEGIPNSPMHTATVRSRRGGR